MESFYWLLKEKRYKEKLCILVIPIVVIVFRVVPAGLWTSGAKQVLHIIVRLVSGIKSLN